MGVVESPLRQLGQSLRKREGTVSDFTVLPGPDVRPRPYLRSSSEPLAANEVSSVAFEESLSCCVCNVLGIFAPLRCARTITEVLTLEHLRQKDVCAIDSNVLV